MKWMMVHISPCQPREVSHDRQGYAQCSHTLRTLSVSCSIGVPCDAELRLLESMPSPRRRMGGT